MATHSPMLMAYPGARLLRLSKYGLEPVSVEQTDHYKVMREFCDGSRGVRGSGAGGMDAAVAGTTTGSEDIGAHRGETMASKRKRTIAMPAPYLRRIWLEPDRIVDRAAYPFCLPFLRDDFELGFDRPITIIVGENGTGKSTSSRGLPCWPAMTRPAAARAMGRSTIPARSSAWAESWRGRFAPAGCRRSRRAGSFAPRAFSRSRDTGTRSRIYPWPSSRHSA